MIYLITDTHLGHENIKHLCDRPNNFNELIIENWKSTVKDNDTVFHLGDAAWGDAWLKQLIDLPGKKILVKGNHDQKSTFGLFNSGFDFVCNDFSAKFEGLDILFSHHPRYFHGHDINIHGHMHNLSREDFSCVHLPLSLENMGYKLIKFDKDFVNKIRRWTTNPQTLSDIMELGQNALKPRDIDLYGPCRNKDLHELRIYMRTKRKALIDKYMINYEKNRDMFERYFANQELSDKEFLAKFE